MKTLITFLLVSFASALQASDFAKETRWAEQIVDFLIDGEAEYLKLTATSFSAFIRKLTMNPKRH